MPGISAVGKALVTPFSTPKLIKPKKTPWKASQKDLKHWKDELAKINKEELAIKRTIKELNAKFQVITMKKYQNSLDNELIEDKKQKEIERSLVHIDSLLKGLRKKNKLHG